MNAILRLARAAVLAAVACVLLPGAALAATQTLFDTTYLIPPSASPGTSGTAFYQSGPLVLTSRGTLTATVTPSIFGAAIQSLSFNLVSASQQQALQFSGPGTFTGSLELDPGTYFAIASGTTKPVAGATTSLGFFGVKIEFSPSAATVVPLPGAAGLLAGALALGGLLFGRRRSTPIADAPLAAAV
jgi:hypothetical protein